MRQLILGVRSDNLTFKDSEGVSDWNCTPGVSWDCREVIGPDLVLGRGERSSNN